MSEIEKLVADIVPGTAPPTSTCGIVETYGGPRASTADRRLLEVVADRTAIDEQGRPSGSTMDEVREILGVSRWRQGHFALSLKDARAEGLVERVERRKGDPFEFVITEAGLRALGRDAPARG